MHITRYFEIKTAIHSLIRLKSGELAYITKRFDRSDKLKLPMEDMAQITGVLTENKYQSSMEKIGKAIRKFSDNPGVDLVAFFDLTLLSFLIGNADMHLKNFSLLTEADGLTSLSPAYDMLSTILVLPQDPEEMDGERQKKKYQEEGFRRYGGKYRPNNSGF